MLQKIVESRDLVNDKSYLNSYVVNGKFILQFVYRNMVGQNVKPF